MAALQGLIGTLAGVAPDRRIELREEILAHGADAIGPLADLAAANPDLGASVTAWLEVLAKRDEAARPSVVTALRGLVATSGEETRRHATDALGRLGARVTAGRAPRSGAAKA